MSSRVALSRMERAKNADSDQVQTIYTNLASTEGKRIISPVEALVQMVGGKIVRRISPTGSAEKFHRIFNGEVQTANTANHLANNVWERAHTDIASWYGSTFCVVRVRVVELDYE